MLKVKMMMAALHPEPVGQFYPALSKKTNRKKGCVLPDTLRCSAPQSIKNGKKFRGNRLDDFPLIKAFTDPEFNLELMEDLNIDAEDFHLL